MVGTIGNHPLISPKLLLKNKAGVSKCAETGECTGGGHASIPYLCLLVGIVDPVLARVNLSGVAGPTLDSATEKPQNTRYSKQVIPT